MGKRLVRAVWIFTFLTAFIIAAITAAEGIWPWPLLHRLPADTRIPLLGFFSNLVLVAITWTYVLITREQLKELQSTRLPNLALRIRVPQFFGGEAGDVVRYGRGNNSFRIGPPIYLDVWNIGTPTIMVTRVKIKVTGFEYCEELIPQILVESGKVAPVNVAYKVMGLTSSALATSPAGLIDFPTDTTTEVHFEACYFSSQGEKTCQIDARFLFRVGDDFINTIVQ